MAFGHFPFGLSQSRGHGLLARVWSGPKWWVLPVRRLASPPLSHHNTRSNKRRVHLVYYPTPTGLKIDPRGPPPHPAGHGNLFGLLEREVRGGRRPIGRFGGNMDGNLYKTSQMSCTFPQVIYVACKVAPQFMRKWGHAFIINRRRASTPASYYQVGFLIGSWYHIILLCHREGFKTPLQFGHMHLQGASIELTCTSWVPGLFWNLPQLWHKPSNSRHIWFELVR